MDRKIILLQLRCLCILCALITLLAGCGSGGGASSDVPQVGTNNNLPEQAVVPLEEQRVIPTSEARPFRADGRYANVLKDCALADLDSLCAFSTLPYIGADSNDPDIDDILDRLLVTHDWMGFRLEELLRSLPDDMLGLFKPVTSIIIGSEVRPSSFYGALGRMQIDAGHLWLTVPEKRTISIAEDFRTNFGSDLRFVSFWRRVIDNDYAVPFASLTDNSERPLETILIRAAAPLYHELAHANDLMRPENIAGLSPELTPLQTLDLFPNQRLSERLYGDPSLTVPASFLYGLARVRYNDTEPNDFERTLLADFVGSEMSNEDKTQFYSYFTIREDIATLFEHAMLKFHFGVDVQVGFMNKPANEADAGCNDYIVDWGSSNRIAAPLVVPRAQWVVEQIIGPSSEITEFFANGIGQETPLTTGIGWCDAIVTNPLVADLRTTRTVSDRELLRRERLMFRNH